MTEKMVAKAVEMKRVMSEGTFFAIRIAVAIGTIISHPEMWNLLDKAWQNEAICDVSEASCDKPAIVKIINVITNEGTVVNIRYRMCEKSGTSVTEAANTVVSDKGETLSPK